MAAEGHGTAGGLFNALPACGRGGAVYNYSMAARMVIRAYRYRYYPTVVQVCRLAIEFGHARWVWNWALAMMTAWYRRYGERLSHAEISRELTFLKRLAPYAWLREASSTVLTQKLRDLDRAFANFFAGRAKYPRFKSRRGPQSVRYQLDQRTVANHYRPGELLRLPRLGSLKLCWSRIPKGVPKMVTVSRDAAGRYWVSMAVEEPVEAFPASAHADAVDLGLKDLFVSARGYRSGNPRHLLKLLWRLRILQRRLARKKKGSGRWRRLKEKIARLHARIRNARRDLLHKVTTWLIRENQAVVIEDLNVRGMLRNRRLARALSDAALGEVRRMLAYKAEWHGRELVVVDRWYPSSKTCSGCGHVLESLALSVREWTCPACGAIHDRDRNAALNLLREGLRILTGVDEGFPARERGPAERCPAVMREEPDTPLCAPA